MKNNKKLVIAGASLAGIATLGLGAFAYFSDSATDTKTAEVGTVNVEVAEAALKHSTDLNNINPGDNDPDVPAENRAGNDHEFSFKIKNEGNKSIITRTVITVSGSNGDSAVSTDVLKNIILSEKANPTSAPSNTDADKKDTISKLTPYGVDGNALVYVIGGTRNSDVLNGTGNNAETETVSSVTEMLKTFDIGLENTVDKNSPLMGATLTFKVEVQAMQYRNTSDAEWDTIFEETFNTKA